MFNLDGDEQEYPGEAPQQPQLHEEQTARPEDNLESFTPLESTEQGIYIPQDGFAVSGDPQKDNDHQEQGLVDTHEPCASTSAAYSAPAANPSPSRPRNEKVKKRKAPESSASDAMTTIVATYESCTISSLLEDIDPVNVGRIKSQETNGYVVNCQQPLECIGTCTIDSQEMSPILANTNRTRESHFQWPFVLSMNCELDGIFLQGVSIVIQKDTREINAGCLAKYYISENSIHITDIKLKKEIRTGDEYTIRFYARIGYRGDSRSFICSWQSHPVLPYCNPQQIPRLISSYYYKHVVKNSHNRGVSFRESINLFHAKYTSERLDCCRYLSDEEIMRVCQMYGVDYQGLDNMQPFWEWFIQAMETISKFIGPNYCKQIVGSREGQPPSKSYIFDCFITRESAEDKLLYSPPGSLLVRVSTTDVTQIVASFRDEEMFYHYQFNKNMFEASKEDGGPPLLKKIALTPFYSRLDPSSRLEKLTLVTPGGVFRLVEIFEDFNDHILGSEYRYR